MKIKLTQLTLRSYTVLASSTTSPTSVPMGAASNTTGATSEMSSSSSKLLGGSGPTLTDSP